MPFKSHVSHRLALLAIVSVISVLRLPAGNDAGLAAEQSLFYQDKVIRIVVGAAPGGGFDVYARALARHWGKYIPGNPQILVENQAGAATLLAAKNVFRAKPDGLTIGNFISDIALGRLLNQPGVDFDFQKFEWIGVPVKDNIVCALTSRAGFSSVRFLSHILVKFFTTLMTFPLQLPLSSLRAVGDYCRPAPNSFRAFSTKL